MLAEYALIPDIFDSSCYSSPEHCNARIEQLKEPLLQEALVRDLRQGEWSGFVGRECDRLHPRTKELLRKLIGQNRLRRSTAIRTVQPTTPSEWCNEAIGSHQSESLSGIIASPSVAGSFPSFQIVQSIEKLSSAPWWQSRSSSVRFQRSTANYLQKLRLILCHANSLMFIDPHLDPSRPGYKDFGAILVACKRAQVQPRIELHRVCYFSSGPQRDILTSKDLEDRFRKHLDATLQAQGLTAEVFIWDNFHDRFLITDLIGMAISNSYDTNNDPHDVVTCTRLGRKERDDLQREFDSVSGRHKLHHRFHIGA